MKKKMFQKNKHKERNQVSCNEIPLTNTQHEKKERSLTNKVKIANNRGCESQKEQ